MLLLVTDHKIF